MKLVFLMLGKTRGAEARATLEDYTKRISRSCQVEILEVRNEDAALKRLDTDRSAQPFLLDAGGRSMNSSQFANWLGAQRDTGTREVIFVCGDADGFPESLRKRVPHTLSLSPMTFSHELARVMLAEQVYRAFAILSGSPYPK